MGWVRGVGPGDEGRGGTESRGRRGSQGAVKVGGGNDVEGLAVGWWVGGGGARHL
jgi:hypothetical protein